MFDKATQGGLPQEDEIWITNRRQKQAAEQALVALLQAREGLEQSKRGRVYCCGFEIKLKRAW